MKPSAFAGKKAGEKKRIYARLLSFIEAHGVGARRRIAEASDGKLKLEDVQAMANAMPRSFAYWEICDAAMDRIENEL